MSKTYRDDFFERLPNAPRGGRGYERYPVANLWEIYPVSKARDKELYCDTSDRDAWDKPFGYWESGDDGPLPATPAQGAPLDEARGGDEG